MKLKRLLVVSIENQEPRIKSKIKNLKLNQQFRFKI